MIPLKDDNPTSSRPIVTYFFIGLCILVFLMQLGSQSYQTGQLFYSYGLIPSVLMGYDQLPIDLYAVPAYLTIFTSMLGKNNKPKNKPINMDIIAFLSLKFF